VLRLRVVNKDPSAAGASPAFIASSGLDAEHLAQLNPSGLLCLASGSDCVLNVRCARTSLELSRQAPPRSSPGTVVHETMVFRICMLLGERPISNGSQRAPTLTCSVAVHTVGKEAGQRAPFDLHERPWGTQLLLLAVPGVMSLINPCPLIGLGPHQSCVHSERH
jgi:hypothetical protein